MRDKIDEVIETISNSEEIRRSQKDPAVYLYYRTIRAGRWLVAVIKILNGDGFLVTAYITGNIKEGAIQWRK